MPFLTRAGLAEGWLGARLWLDGSVDRLLAARGALCRDRDLDTVETLCLFVGYPRSGHSLIGSLVDAHPDAAVAHRLDAVKYLQAGFAPRQVMALMLRNAQRFNARGRRLTRYRYAIDGAWQGEIRRLRLIGDQEGRATAERLGTDPETRRRLRELDGPRLKLLHVVRNPFDNTSTMALRTGQTLEQAIERYFTLCDRVATVKRAGFEVLDLHHERTVADPAATLERICGFLGLDAPARYVRACVAVVHRSAHRSREEMPWTPLLVRAVERRMARYDFLRRYGFAD